MTTHLQSGEELYDINHPDGPEVSDDEGDDANDDNEEARRQRLELKKSEQRAEDLEEYYSDIGYRDSSYGYHDIHSIVWVDGVEAGTISAVLIPRTRYQSIFHEAADAHSGELRDIGWTLCDASGRPRIKSIKDADVDGSAIEGGLLHIIKVTIKQSYRANDCTEVVSRALRLAVADPKLKGRWTLATAISDDNVYMTGEEKKLQDELRWSMGDEDDDVREKRKKLSARQDVCRLLDTRTFMRVGYTQIPELVGADPDKPVYLFALPAYVTSPLLSIDDAMQIKLHEPPELPPDPKGVDDTLFQLVKRTSNAMRRHLDTIDYGLQEYQTAFASFEDLETELARARQNIDEGRPEHVPVEDWEQMMSLALDEKEEKIAALRAEFMEKSKSMHEQISATNQDARNEILDELKRSAGDLVREKGASVRKSFALHCACRLRVQEFVDVLLDLVPEPERRLAMSEIDASGETPLHCSVIGTKDLKLSNADKMHSFVDNLVRLGASCDAKSTVGLTPLGLYRTMMSERFEFAHAFGISSAMNSELDPEKWRPFHLKMEQALKPPGGETDADVEAKPSALSLDEEFWEESDEESLSDDDEDEMDLLDDDEENENDDQEMDVVS